MAQLVCNGAMLMCTFGLGPSTFVVTPENKVIGGGAPAATIMDNIFGKNIPPFPLCNAKANPTVIAATTAALGTPTPAACVGVFPGPWVTGAPTAMIANKPALNSTSKLTCAYGGQISIAFPGQVTVNVP